MNYINISYKFMVCFVVSYIDKTIKLKLIPINNIDNFLYNTQKVCIYLHIEFDHK